MSQIRDVLLTENYHTLTPAYGRDYKSKAAILVDFNAGKDFILQPQGLPINNAQIAQGVTVNIRYAQLRKVAVCVVV